MQKNKICGYVCVDGRVHGEDQRASKGRRLTRGDVVPVGRTGGRPLRLPWVRAGYPFRGTIAWDICQEAPAVAPHSCNVQYAGRIGARLSVFSSPTRIVNATKGYDHAAHLPVSEQSAKCKWQG